MLIYSPAEDSYLLEKQIKKLAKDKSILDMGTGSGIQARAALQAKASSVTAADINKEAIKQLKKQNPKIKSIHSNLFQNIKGKFDIIAFNPPYLPQDKREDKESRLTTTGGKRGDEITLRFLNQAVKHLNKDGTILIIVSSLTPRSKIIKLLGKLNLTHKILDSERVFFETLEVWDIKN